MLWDAGGRGFLHHFLMAALQRAIAVTQMDRVACTVSQYLHFHMSRFLQEFFHVDGGIAEGVLGFGAGQGDGVEQVFGFLHDAHAAPTTTGGGLDDDRVTNLFGHGQ